MSFSFSRTDVDTEKLAEASARMMQASATYDDIAGQLVSLSARLAALSSLDISGAGADALSVLGSSAVRMGAEKILIDSHAKLLEVARERYESVEAAAIGLFASITGATVIENKALALDLMVGFSAEYFKQHAGQFIFIESKALWDISGLMARSPEATIRSTGYLLRTLSLALFGMSAYMDVRAGGKAFMLRNIFDRFAVMGYSAEDLRAGLHSIFKRGGVFAPLNHHKTSVFADQEGRGLSTNIDDLSAIAENLQLAGEVAEARENSGLSRGNAQRYAGIAVQVVTAEKGEQYAVVYIPGTDVDSLDVGDLLGLEGALELTEMDGGTSYEESTAISQLIDEALKDAGIASTTPVMMVGHSQGAMAAFNSAANPYLAGKYNIKQVVSFGGPTGTKEKVAGVKYTEVRDRDDMIVELQGHTAEYTADADDRIFYTDTNGDKADFFKSGESLTWGLWQGHHMHEYSHSLAHPETSVLSDDYTSQLGFMPTAATSSQALLVQGSRLPENSSMVDIHLNSAAKADDMLFATGLEIAKNTPEQAAEWGKDQLKENLIEKVKGSTEGVGTDIPIDSQSSEGTVRAEKTESRTSNRKVWEDPEAFIDTIQTYKDLATGKSEALEGAASETLEYLGPDSPEETFLYRGSEIIHDAFNARPESRTPVDWAQEFNLNALTPPLAPSAPVIEPGHWAYQFEPLHSAQPVTRVPVR